MFRGRTRATRAAGTNYLARPGDAATPRLDGLLFIERSSSSQVFAASFDR